MTTAHDGPCTYVGAQSGPIVVYRCRCGAERPLAAAEPDLDRRAALQRQADADKALRALKEQGRNPRLPFMPRRLRRGG